MANFAKIEQLVKSRMEAFAVPSISLGVVKGEEVVYQGFFGYRDMENKLVPNAQTRYACASVTKAMTATCLGMLKDEGKVDWDTPVIEYLPEFRMYDEYATQHVTLRDMLSHNTGLPRHDQSWYNWGGESLTTAEYVERVRYFKPNKGFRGGYEYNNFMFTVAGYVVERLSGMPWGQFITERLFEPLGMSNTTTVIDGLRLADNRALPYVRKNGKPAPTGYNNFNGMAGCGCVNSTVEDMVKLSAFNIGKGEYKGKRLVSEKVMNEIHAPRNVVPAIPGIFNPEMPMAAYGFGWGVLPFRGRLCLQHSGGIDGFSSYFTFMPNEKIGIIVFANLEVTSFHRAVAAAVYDLMLGVEEEKDWPATYAAMDEVNLSALKKENDKVLAAVKADAPCTHALADYAGLYTNPGYGTVKVTFEGGVLKSTFNGMTWPLEHSNYDSFHVTYDVDSIPQMVPFTFRLAEAGDIAALEARMEPSLKEPIIFTKEKEA